MKMYTAKDSQLMRALRNVQVVFTDVSCAQNYAVRWKN